MDEWDDSISAMNHLLVMEKVRQMEAAVAAVMKEAGCQMSEVNIRWLGVGKGFDAIRVTSPQEGSQK